MTEEKMITLTLAHPLTAQQAEWHQATDVKDYGPGQEITVPLSRARSIIGSGYAAGVDPNEPDQVNAALEGQAKESSQAKTSSSAKK